MILKQVFWRTFCLAPFWIIEITDLAHFCTEGPFCQCPVSQLVCNTVLIDVNGRCYVEFFFFYILGKSQLSIVIYLELNIIVLITCIKQTSE